MGSMLTANNNYSQITRTYYPNGALKTDQQAIKEYESGSFTTHVYDLSYDYDLDGRRTAIHHPSWLSPGTDRTDYQYDSGTGRLSTITDPLGNSYGFTYDGNGQPVTRSYPVGGDSLAYDAAGRLEYYNGLTISRDPGGRVTFAGSTAYEYNGFGHLLESDDVGSDVYEYFERDAFGNASFHHGFPRFYGPDDVPGSAFANTHPAQKGRRMSVSEEEWTFDTSPSQPSNWDPGWKTFTSDSETGHRIAAGSESYTWQFSGGTEGYDTADKQAEHRSYSRSYYSVDGKLMVHQVNRDSLDYRFYDPPQDTTIFYGDPWGAYEEYWYDALGRRVLKRSRQNSPICTDTDRCQSSIERFVWDGDQILWELRTSSGSVDTQDPTGSGYTGQSGSIGYVHAGDIDKPLGMMRNGSPIVLHHNWRGMVEAATDTSGTQVATDVPWPGGRWKATGQFLDPREVHTWVGSLPMGQADHSGLQYRRNRYYNPESGQFTQQDPIGIAGGLNVYGYADGDPINLSDPFGLSPCIRNPQACGLFVQGATAINPALGGLVLGGVVAGTLLTSPDARDAIGNVAASIDSRIKQGILGVIAGISSLLPQIQPGESSDLERERRRREGEQVQEQVLEDEARPRQEPPEEEEAESLGELD